MNARIAGGEQSCDVNYNAIHNIEDVTGSGNITEPVSLQEAKDYLRLEGFGDPAEENVTVQGSVALTLAGAATAITNSNLAGATKTLITVTRSGLNYGVITTGTPGELEVLHDKNAGTITFSIAGNTGGEPVNVVYGVTSTGVIGDEFDFDDTLVSAMITEGRMWVEKYTGVHLVEKQIEVSFVNGAGMIELPGPVTGDIAVTDELSAAVADVQYIGTLFPKVKTIIEYIAKAAYTVGYGADCPEWAKNAIKAYVAWAYENRGDTAAGSPDRAAAICRIHRKVKSYA